MGGPTPWPPSSGVIFGSKREESGVLVPGDRGTLRIKYLVVAYRRLQAVLGCTAAEFVAAAALGLGGGMRDVRELAAGSGFAPAERALFLLRPRPVTIAAWLIFCAWVANVRWGFKTLFVTFSPSDAFADFLKLILSYPGAPAHSSAMPELIARYSTGHEADLSGAIFTSPGTLVFTHFNMPPMTTAISVLCRRATSFIDPIWLFAGLALAVEAYLLGLAVKAGRDLREKLALAVIVALAFSNVFMIARGNLYAGLCCALLIHSVVALPRRPILAAVLLALACNIRPNAIVFAIPAIALGWADLRRYGTALVATGAAVFAASMLAAHALYYDYSLTTFTTGLAIYNRTYVAGDEGMNGAAAIFSPLKLWLGYSPAALISVALAAIFAGTAYLNRQGPRSVMLFFTCAAYVALTVALGDYYLTAFAAVPILAANERPGAGAGIATVAAALVMAPMAFGTWSSHSTAVFLYPFLVSLGVVALAIVEMVTRMGAFSFWVSRSVGR